MVLNGQSPTWEKVSARATQGCVYIRSFVFLNVYQWSYLWIIINSSSCYNIQVFRISCKRNLDFQLDKKFNFTYHINIIIFKADEGIDITGKLYKVLLGISLITICKSFIRSDLDFGAFIFDQPAKYSLKKWIKKWISAI